VLITLGNREDLIGLPEANRDRVLVSAGEILGSRRSLLMEDQPTSGCQRGTKSKNYSACHRHESVAPQIRMPECKLLDAGAD
jgi:hypothetical protein